MKQSFLIPVIVLMSFGSPASAQVYKCTDDSGAVQYSDIPCGSSTLSLHKLGDTESGAAAPDVRMEKTQRLLDAIHDERQQKQHNAEEAKAELEQRRNRCNHARDYLRNLERANRVYRLDESGNRVYLQDDAREQSLVQARANVDNWCK